MLAKAARFCVIIVLFSVLAVQTPADTGSSEYIWRASTGGRIRGRPAAARDGTVYALSEDRHLYALSEYTGRIEWRTYLGGRVWDSLSIGADGTIYTVLKDGDLVAVGRGGGVAWKLKAAGTPVGNPAAVDDGTIYVALDSAILLAVSHTGGEKWRVHLPAPPVTGPAVGRKGDVYVGCADRKVVAYTPWGEPRWNALLAGVPSEPAISKEGKIYYGTDFGSIVALDETGAIDWDYVSSSGFLSPVMGVDRILAATVAGEVVALGLDGNIIWRRSANERLTGYLTVTAGNDLIALSDRGYLLRFNDGGRITERFDVRESGLLFGVTPTGKYVFGRDDWLVYAFQGSLPGDTGWSQPGGNPQHTSSAMERGGTAAWLEAFSGDVDFLILDRMVHNSEPEMKEKALQEITEGIRSKDRVPPYYHYFLSHLASEGTLRATTEYGAVTNDYPGIRGRAAELLGKIGTLQSADLLVRLLTYEYDPAVRRKIIAAMGELKTDRTGRATAAISGVVLEDMRRRETPDPRLADAALKALASIRDYNGLMPDESGNELLFEIYRGAYPKRTRELALEAMKSPKR
ncbi:MAG: PQQ-binding-like beta-propeller repeat protein [Spirochaetales bacterium]|nr:PQQ-binding-like beta-propeller repeat protein [Spirochaetales bacterium]